MCVRIISANLVMITLHTVGDSHASAAHGPWTFTLPNAQLAPHHLGPRLMYTFGRTPDIVDLRSLGVMDGDWVVFCFGEIDCRCHVLKYVTETTSVVQIVTELVDRYVSAIVSACTGLRVRRLVMFVTPTMAGIEVPHEFPYLGTDQQRVEVTRTMNTALCKACAANSLEFIDLTEHYSGPDGLLRRELSDGNCHMKDWEPLRAWFMGR